MRTQSNLLLIVLFSASFALAQPKQPTPEQVKAREAGERYLNLVQSWAKDVEFTPEESAAMEAGKKHEAVMKKGPDDPLAKEIMARGEPSWDALAAVYPGKVLDRTVLGTWSDPTQPMGKYNNEFAIYWNGAIAADLLPQRHNTVVEFKVGPNAEAFGRVRKNYTSINYERGYLPIITARYDTDGVRYTQTAFAWNPNGETDGWDIAFVSMEAKNTSDAAKRANIKVPITLMSGEVVSFKNRYVFNSQGAVLVAVDDAAKFADGALNWQFDLAPGQSKRATLKIPLIPDAKHLVNKANADEFAKTHEAAVSFWQGLLDKGARVDVPEERVNKIWRALLLQNFVLADGPRFTYGSGLRYNDNTYPYENGFAAHTFAMYGHDDYADALQEWFIKMTMDPKGAGRKYQNRRAMALHHLLETYRFTGKQDLWDRHKADYLRVADEIVADQHSTMTETNGEKPLHYGLLPPEKAAADVEASTQKAYVLGHNVTNCQGLADLGRFLVITRIDPARGEKYLKEAANFRECILRAMKEGAIRQPGLPPFLDLQTLYFKDTADYGPQPYDDMGFGRLQGIYSHYWVDMEMHYNFFNPDDEPAQWLADYSKARNGFVLGLTRGRSHAGQIGAINPVYDGGYYNFRLRQGKIDEFLLGFYSRLAFAHSRYTYVSSEAQPFIEYNTHDGGFVGPNYSIPNSAANGDTLWMLRLALVMEELKDNVETGKLFLMRGAPSAWLADGKRTSVENFRTYFGHISFNIERTGEKIVGTIDPPRGEWKEIALSLRQPLKQVTINGEASNDFDADGTITIPHRDGKITVEAIVK
jgi:hypothetical protein